MMAKFVLILYVPGIPALSMSDIDFDFGGVWPKEIIKSNRDCLYVLVRNVTLLLLLLLLYKYSSTQFSDQFGNFSYSYYIIFRRSETTDDLSVHLSALKHKIAPKRAKL